MRRFFAIVSLFAGVGLFAACSNSSGGGRDADQGGQGGAIEGEGGQGGHMSQAAGSSGRGGDGGGAAGAAGGENRVDAGSGTPDAGQDARPSFVYLSGYDPQIRIYELSADGTLSLRGMANGATNPSYLAIGPDGKNLYAVSEGNPGKIIAFSIDRARGTLTKINEASTGGNGPAHVSVDRTGKWVFAANYGDGAVGVLAVLPTGGVQLKQTLNPFARNSHQIVNDPSGKFVVVPATGPNAIAQYAFDAQAGTLTPNTPATVAGPSAPQNHEPRHLAFHPARPFAYHINERTSALTSWKFDVATGRLSDPETIAGLPQGFSGNNSGAHVVVHPNGMFVYSSNRGHNSITIAAVDPTTGRLKVLGHETGAGKIKTPRGFAVDPTGKWLIVANQDANSALVFKIKADGLLEAVGEGASMPKPTFVGFLPL